MPHAADGATACVLNGRLYVIGGYSSNKLQVLEMTEENGLSWSCKAELPANRYSAASVVHEGKVCVIGGAVNGGPSTAMLTYDADADAWGTAPPLPMRCSGCRATTIEGRILLFGIGMGIGGIPHILPQRVNGGRFLQYANSAWSQVAEAPVTLGFCCGAMLLG